MSCNDGGDLAAAVDHIQDHEQDHVAIRSMDEAAGSEEDEKGRGDRELPFFQCTDGEEPSGMDDAATEFPGGDDDDDEGYDDGRVSFATAVDDRLWEEQAELEVEEAEEDDEDMSRYDYGMWIATEPMSIQERRRRLLHGMGLAASSRDLLRSRNPRTMRQQLPPDIPRSVAPRRRPPLPAASPERGRRQNNAAAALTWCRSDSRLAVRGGRKPPALRRFCSLPHSLHGSPGRKALRAAARCPLPSAAASKDGGNGNGSRTDIGKEFMVNGQIKGRQSGAQMSVDEFERFIGYTPLVTQLIRRSQSQPVPPSSDGAKPVLKKRTRWLKNIKLVASVANLINETKDKAGNGRSRSRSSSASDSTMSKSASAHVGVPSCGASGLGTERLKVHHYGTSSKELTGLYLRQEVLAHEGSIWTMKFSPDAQLLATGGEDRVVRVWRVVDGADAQEHEHPTSMPPTPPLAAAEDRPGLAAQLSRKVRLVGRSSKHVLPEHVVVPESVFALAEQPACAFEGHQDDVLDLSWSKSQVHPELTLLRHSCCSTG
jgi:WD repeat-containing protein 44